MRNFQGTFATLKRSFISAFLVYMAVPFNHRTAGFPPGLISRNLLTYVVDYIRSKPKGTTQIQYFRSC